MYFSAAAVDNDTHCSTLAHGVRDQCTAAVARGPVAAAARTSPSSLTFTRYFGLFGLRTLVLVSSLLHRMPPCNTGALKGSSKAPLVPKTHWYTLVYKLFGKFN